MRTARQIPWYLIASILISLSALALANLLPQSLKETGTYIALALVILIPGYLAVLSLFPAAGDLDLNRRLLLSLFASAILAGLISLILYFTPRRLEPASLATILSFLTLFLAALSYLRWRALPRSRRFIIGAKRGYRAQRPTGRASRSLTARLRPLLIALAAVLILAGLSLAIYHYHPVNLFSSPEGYTQLEVTWPESETGDSSEQEYTTLTAGRDLEARARIDNHEGSPVNYSLRLVFDNSTIFVKGLSLGDNETWDSMLGFALAGQPGKQRLDLLLFKEGDSTTPYKSEHLLVDLIDDQSGDLDTVENSSNESTESSASQPVSFEETTKVTVLSAGGGGGVSASAAAPSAKSPPKSAAKETEKQTAKETAENPPPAEDAVQTSAGTGGATAGSSETEAQPAASIISGESPSAEETEPSTGAVQADAAASKERASGPENASANASTSIFSSDNPSYSPEYTPSPAVSASISSNPAPAADETIKPVPEEAAPLDQPEDADPISDGPAEEEAISNQPPVLHSLLPDKPSPQTKGTAIIWRAEAEDPDGDRILYRFLLNGTQERKWSKSSSWSWPTQYLNAGEYTITVQAMDGLHSPSDSYDSSLDATMTILDQNQPPILKELEADPKSPSSQGSLITWTATAIDPDQDELSYRFLLDGRETSGWSPSDSWTWNSSGAAAGDHEITVQIMDGTHASQDSFDGELNLPYTLTESKIVSPAEPSAESSAAPLAISAESSSKSAGALAGASSVESLNQIPILAELVPDAISPVEWGGIINWTARATDPDGDGLSYKFLLDGQDVTGWSSSPSWSWNTSGALPGTHKITALARDGKHASADSFDGSMDAAFTLEEKNQPPILLSLEPDLSSPRVPGETIVWKAEARDPDNDPILYKFQLEGNDMVRWSESNSWSWSTRGLEAGDYRVTVLVRDGRHASEYSSDGSLAESFSLNTAIDQQIDQLMSQRGFEASGNADYHSSDIRLKVADPKA